MVSNGKSNSKSPSQLKAWAHRQQNAIGLDSLLMITYKKGKQRGFPVTGMIYKTKSAAMYDFKEMVEDEGITLSEMNRIYEICYLDVLNDVLGD